MKKLLTVLVLTTMLVSCTSRNEFGECIGAGQMGDPALNYEYSSWNMFVGVIFSEMIIPPLVVVFDDLKCPVGRK